MKHVAICFGGISPEHEVSVITGLQVIENIETSEFIPYALYVAPSGEFSLLRNLTDRSDFLKTARTQIRFGRDDKGGYFETVGLFGKKTYLDCAYFAFHGGTGESGQLQGMFESLGIPHTGATVLGAALSMNKAATKEMLTAYEIPSIPGVSVDSDAARLQTKDVVSHVLEELKLPVIVKPSHLGSSIGVTIAKTSGALTKALLAASQIDSEIVIEKLMEDFIEYNCAVKRVNGELLVSEVERPIKKDLILSFADKYERGGGKKTGGMASLSRELPAKISPRLKDEIQELAKTMYEAVRAEGMLRCDFMLVGKRLYPIEINPIPGSMAFYLWEASGMSFTDQITEAITEAIRTFENAKEKNLKYDSDIIKNFVNSTDH